MLEEVDIKNLHDVFYVLKETNFMKEHLKNLRTQKLLDFIYQQQHMKQKYHGMKPLA